MICCKLLFGRNTRGLANMLKASMVLIVLEQAN